MGKYIARVECLGCWIGLDVIVVNDNEETGYLELLYTSRCKDYMVAE